MSELYPWEGDYITGKEESPVAIVTLGEKMLFDKDKVAIWGPMKTENLGIEKVIANTISNPNIRFLIICGEEIRGHLSGSSLLALLKNGIDENGRIIDSPGAVPYIENIDKEAVDRFREQIEPVNMIGINDKDKIDKSINEAIDEDPKSFGEPYIAIRIKKKTESKFEADMALHASLKVSPWGEISKMEEV